MVCAEFAAKREHSYSELSIVSWAVSYPNLIALFFFKLYVLYTHWPKKTMHCRSQTLRNIYALQSKCSHDRVWILKGFISNFYCMFLYVTFQLHLDLRNQTTNQYKWETKQSITLAYRGCAQACSGLALRPRGNCKQPRLCKWKQGRLCLKPCSLWGILQRQIGLCCLVMPEVSSGILQLQCC